MADHVLEIQMASEHLERSSKAKPKDAIIELIWNSCDADATNIEVILERSAVSGFTDTIERVVVRDNGHGIKFESMGELFGKYGKSEKTSLSNSPKGRQFHGKLGQGRYKSFSIGASVTWHSVYLADDGKKYRFSIYFDATNKMSCTYSEKDEVPPSTSTGVEVVIGSIMETVAQLSNIQVMKDELISTFAAYLLAYQDIKVSYDLSMFTLNDQQELRRR